MLAVSLSQRRFRSHRDAEANLECPDFLDENEPLDGSRLISDDDGNAISLPSDGGLEISGTEVESEAKSKDGKSLSARVTMAMIRCAFLKVRVEEEMFAEFRDVDGIEDESIEQDGSSGEGWRGQRSSTRSSRRPWLRKRC